MFNPSIEIGDELSNSEISTIFKCGNMGGMRRSKKTNTLVIITDSTKGFYHDKWKNGILYYTGMGKHGDQVLRGSNNQNITLYESDTNGVSVHLFEVLKKTVYTYRGIVKLVDKPYQTTQPDEDGRIRKVWIFPIAPIDEIKKTLENPSDDLLAKLSPNELNYRSSMMSGPKEPKLAETTVYYRDPYLKEIVKRIAEGKCQLCGNDAPFIDNAGSPYLEEHHVVRLADGGSDTIDNVVALCPNCHRKIHILNDTTDVIVLEGISEQNKKRLERLLAYSRITHSTKSK